MMSASATSWAGYSSRRGGQPARKRAAAPNSQLLGGKDNFAADRAAGDRFLAAYPKVVHSVRANRAFIARAVRFLAAEEGIRQFLDIGTGIPTAGNTHEVAQRVAPDSRIVYVDNDPIVLSRARSLLNSSREGACACIDADLRDPGKILAAAGDTLDFTRRPDSELEAARHAAVWAGVARKP